MNYEEFLPPWELIFWSVAFGALAFENQRWRLAMGLGRVSYISMVRNPGVSFLVSLTGFLGLLLSIAVLAAVFIWGGGWKPALGLLAINLIGGLVTTTFTTLLFGGDNGDNVFIWLLATLGMYPVGYFLAMEALALSG